MNFEQLVLFGRRKRYFVWKTKINLKKRKGASADLSLSLFCQGRSYVDAWGG
jgi:hypothetical protein